MKAIKLIKIDPTENNNKFYNISELPGGKFEIHFGRVGTDGRKIQDDMSNWDSTLRSKLRKGYEDVTANSTITRITGSTGADLGTLKPKIKNLLELLHKYAKETFAINYTVEATDVSELLVQQAQDIIDKINSKLKLNANVPEINALLISLYKKIPRKIRNVQESLIPPITDKTILDKANDKMIIEQGLIDVVKSQIVSSAAIALDPPIKQSKALTYLDQLGLDIDEISASEEKMLKDMLEETSHKYLNAYKVTNFKTQKAFDAEIANAKNKTTKLLFHGSNTQNWLGILKSGLVLHKSSSAGLFNSGIYFADRAQKSLNYITGGMYSKSSADAAKSSVTDNWLAIFEVHLGNAFGYNDLIKIEGTRQSIDLAQYVPKNGYDSFFGEKGLSGGRYKLVNNEYIVYNEHKCTIKYLVHINH